MTPAGDIVNNILKAARRHAIQSVRENVWRWLNIAYFELCKTHSWQLLRRTTTLDFATASSTGLWLPANKFGIDAVYDEDAGIEFIDRNRSDIDPQEPGYRFYTYAASQIPEFLGLEDGTVAQNANTFVCPSLGTTDYTGDYVKFGKELGYHLLTGALAFSPYYRGPDLDGVDVMIRPKETERMVLVDPAGDVLTDRDVVVHYWEAPVPMYRESDTPVLPIATPIELKVLIIALGTVGKRQIAADRYRNELMGTLTKKGAIDEALELNPDFPRANFARDKHNVVMGINPNMFRTRT